MYTRLYRVSNPSRETAEKLQSFARDTARIYRDIDWNWTVIPAHRCRSGVEQYYIDSSAPRKVLSVMLGEMYMAGIETEPAGYVEKKFYAELIKSLEI